MNVPRRNTLSVARILICVLFLFLSLGPGRPANSAESKPPQNITNTLGMKFVLLPVGDFQMGSSQEDLRRMAQEFKQATGREYKPEWATHVRDEEPRHQVEITRPFYIQAHEVTNDQFAAFVKATGYRTTAELQDGGWTYGRNGWRPLPGADWRHPLGPHDSIEGKGSHPVVQVSWVDADAFCRWLSQKEGRSYKLPSEAKWEYACRGGRAGEIFCWGLETPPRTLVANLPDQAYARMFGSNRYHVQGYDDGYATTAPVGTFNANGFGLYDMVGNVWEWCSDWYDNGYYSHSPLRDPPGPSSGTHRVLRGGSYCYLPSNQRCADRFRNLPLFRCPFAGFRLILKP